MTLKNILVAFDGSPSSNKAFDFALELSVLCPGEARNVFVLAVAQPPQPEEIVETEAIIDAVKKYYQGLFEELREKGAARNITINTDVAEGDPADQIVRYAAEKGIDMIVMGRRGKSKLENLLLGSVSKRVADLAPCTVTIVK